MAKVQELYAGNSAWWMARRDKGRAHDFPIFFEHAGRPADVHMAAGRLLGLPAGYGYKIAFMHAAPKDLVLAGDRDGLKFFMERLKM